MIKQSLGLIETIGLTAAIEAADTAVKSANVQIVGYEITKGQGMVVVKLLGEVAAVNAAIAAATIAANKVSRVVSTKVIARVGEGLEGLIHSKETKNGQHEPAQPRAALAVKAKSTEKIAVVVTSNDDVESLGCQALVEQQELKITPPTETKKVAPVSQAPAIEPEKTVVKNTTKKSEKAVTAKKRTPKKSV